MICDIKRCRQGGILIYYGKQVCNKHWLKHCDEEDNFNLKKELMVYD